jgi:very-short-patch-repair endonuclease
LVDAWPWLPTTHRRAPIISAVNGRLTTPQRIGDALIDAPTLPARAELRGLLAKLAAGCRSALEIWGDDRVFVGSGMPGFVRQFPIRLDGYTAYLDIFHEETRVNFELDGASVHGSPRQREIDLRRDAALAARGILVIRLSHARLTNEPEAVRREVLMILRSRTR